MEQHATLLHERAFCRAADELIDRESEGKLATTHKAGFTVYIRPTNVAATNQKTGEKFIVNYDGDIYDAVVEPSQQIGIELEDG